MRPFIEGFHNNQLEGLRTRGPDMPHWNGFPSHLPIVGSLDAVGLLEAGAPKSRRPFFLPEEDLKSVCSLKNLFVCFASLRCEEEDPELTVQVIPGGHSPSLVQVWHGLACSRGLVEAHLHPSKPEHAQNPTKQNAATVSVFMEELSVAAQYEEGAPWSPASLVRWELRVFKRAGSPPSMEHIHPHSSFRLWLPPERALVT